ncbi:MAG TPA: alpha/beta hydrolase [Myxococcota bacterium]
MTHPPRALPTRPEDVPAAVDTELLRALLERGRPPAVDGDADDVVIWLHGLGHDAWDFGRVIALRPSGLQTRAFDLPGFGPHILDAPPRAIDLADLVDSLVAAARACPKPPVVAASSLGGHVALIAAMEHPGIFAGLSLLAPGGLVSAPSTTEAMLRRYYDVAAIMGRADEDIVRNSRRIFVRPGTASDELATRKLSWHRATPAAKEQFAVPFSTIVDDVLKRPIHDVVHQLDGLPMQVLYGDGDVVVPLASGRLLERVCHAQLTIMRNTGHTPHLEDPEATAHLVYAFAHGVFAAIAASSSSSSSSASPSSSSLQQGAR